MVKGNLEISKYAKNYKGEADTSQPIKGVKFTITGPDNYKTTVTTDEKGKINLSGLTPGDYTITESDVSGADPKVEEPEAPDKT